MGAWRVHTRKGCISLPTGLNAIRVVEAAEAAAANRQVRVIRDKQKQHTWPFHWTSLPVGDLPRFFVRQLLLRHGSWVRVAARSPHSPRQKAATWQPLELKPRNLKLTLRLLPAISDRYQNWSGRSAHRPDLPSLPSGESSTWPVRLPASRTGWESWPRSPTGA